MIEKIIDGKMMEMVKNVFNCAHSYKGLDIQRKDIAEKREKQNRGFNLYQQKREIQNGYEMTIFFMFDI